MHQVQQFGRPNVLRQLQHAIIFSFKYEYNTSQVCVNFKEGL